MSYAPLHPNYIYMSHTGLIIQQSHAITIQPLLDERTLINSVRPRANMGERERDPSFM